MYFSTVADWRPIAAGYLGCTITSTSRQAGQNRASCIAVRERTLDARNAKKAKR
jgi:hypothetical protein